MGLFDKLKKKRQSKVILTEEKTSNEEKHSGKAFIFCEERELNKIMNALCHAFNINTDGNGNTIELHNEDIDIFVTTVTEEMGDDAKTFIKNQINSTYGHYYHVDTEYVDNKINVLYKIDLSHGFIIIDYSFNAEDEDDKKAMIMERFSKTLPELKGILLLCDKEDGLYCENDRGIELILSESGKSTVFNYLPKQEFTITPEDGQVTEEQISRRLKSRKIIEDKFIYVPAWYPVIETAENSKCRSKEDIAKRAIALMIVSLYSECLISEDMKVSEAYEFVNEIIERFDAKEFFSPREKEYLQNPNPTKEEQIAYSWQYENLFVMEWALGLVDELDFPDHICDVPLTVNLLKDYYSIEEIVENSKPKSNESLLDECDLIFCLDWACVDTRIHNLPAPAKMDKGVVLERHKSLNWLVGYNENAEWDKVGTDT
ncbi:DUF4272 domain-containing protein [Clostridium sp. CH2]|uniref:DUF4272 domain-containing protein n=1 Tax=Clostridium sp. CH2 TaxID=2949990 RepID=UPI002079F04C|nr:DUF4272 domain-containing protein [Clostridium sp. CH2]